MSVAPAGLLREVDLDHAAARGVVERRRQSLDGVADPLAGRRGEVEIAIDAIHHAFAAERFQPGVDRLADGAEFDIGGVAERQHAKLDAVEARRALAHQFAIAAHRAGRRFALAPGGGDDDEFLGLGQVGRLEIGHIDQIRLQAVLARGFGEIIGERFAIAGFAGVDNRQRLGRARRRRRLGRLNTLAALHRLDAGQEAGQPGALHRRGRPDHLVEQSHVLFGEGGGFRNGRETRGHAETALPRNARQHAGDDEHHERGEHRHHPAVARQPGQEALRIVRIVLQGQLPSLRQP